MDILILEVYWMKKAFVAFVVIIGLVLLVGCKPKVDYAEEFNFLPKYEKAEFQEFIENKAENTNEKYITATYIVKNAKQEDVINEYESVLHDDGWTTTFENKPLYITVTKEDHEANISTSQRENDVFLAIVAK